MDFGEVRHTIRVGSRGSDLALIQTEHVLSLLRRSGIDESMKVQVIRTSGDRAPASNPAAGSFADAINDMVIDEQLDIGVHSMKDLPAILPSGLEIAVVPRRAGRHDCLVGPATLYRLPSGSTVGTSSPRRIAQTARVRPDLKIVGLRGNVTTRVSALSSGKTISAVLAVAGLERLDPKLPDGIGIYPLPLDHFVPAAGQGALAVVCRKGYIPEEVRRSASDRQTLGETVVERAVLRELDAGCSTPLGISAVSFGRGYTVHIQLLSPDGSREAKLTAGISSDGDVTGIISSFEKLRASRFGQ